VLGAALGYCLGTLGPTALTLTLSFAAGAMLYVVFGELLPEAAGLWKSKLPALAAVLGILVGMLIDG
jgi:ZIP family zinc transporter